MGDTNDSLGEALKWLPSKLYASVERIFRTWGSQFLSGSERFGVVPYGFNPGRTQAYWPPPPLWNRRVYADLMYVYRGIGLMSTSIDELISREGDKDGNGRPGAPVYGVWFSMEEVRNDWYQCAPYAAMLNRQLWCALDQMALGSLEPGESPPEWPAIRLPTSSTSTEGRVESMCRALAALLPAIHGEHRETAVSTVRAEAAAVRAQACLLQLAALPIEPDLAGLLLVTGLTQTMESEMSRFVHYSLEVHPAWRQLDLALSLEA